MLDSCDILGLIWCMDIVILSIFLGGKIGLG